MAGFGKSESGLRGRDKLKADLTARFLKHEKKEETDLEATVKDNQERQKSGQKARTTAVRKTDADLAKGKTPLSRRARAVSKAASLRKQATAAAKTGNKKAAATFRQAADLYIARLKKAPTGVKK